MPWLHNLCRSALAVAVLTTALRGHLCRWNCINRNHSIIAHLWCKHGFFWVHKPLLPVLIFLRFLSVHTIIVIWYDVCISKKKARFVQNIRVTGWFMLLPTFVVFLIKTDPYIIEQMAENSNSDEVAERWHSDEGAVSFNSDRRSCDYRPGSDSKWLDDWKTRKTKHDHISGFLISKFPATYRCSFHLRSV